MMNEILILTTGGTIDKIYFDAKNDYQVGKAPDHGYSAECTDIDPVCDQNPDGKRQP